MTLRGEGGGASGPVLMTAIFRLSRIYVPGGTMIEWLGVGKERNLW